MLKFLKNWSELLTIPLGFMLWWMSADLIRLFDETAATFDAGIFQVIIFAIIQLFVFAGVVRIMMKMQWPELDAYLDKIFKSEVNFITPWQRLKISTSVFFLFLFALILLSRVL